MLVADSLRHPCLQFQKPLCFQETKISASRSLSLLKLWISGEQTGFTKLVLGWESGTITIEFCQLSLCSGFNVLVVYWIQNSLNLQHDFNFAKSSKYMTVQVYSTWMNSVANSICNRWNFLLHLGPIPNSLTGSLVGWSRCRTMKTQSLKLCSLKEKTCWICRPNASLNHQVHCCNKSVKHSLTKTQFVCKKQKFISLPEKEIPVGEQFPSGLKESTEICPSMFTKHLFCWHTSLTSGYRPLELCQ